MTLASRFAHLVVWTLVVQIAMLATLSRETPALLIPLAPHPAGGLTAIRLQDLETVQAALEIKMVQQRLADLGLSQDEIRARLNGLSDADLHTLASNLDGLIHGGSTALGLLLGLVIVFLILVILYVSGYRIAVTR